jgi:hypothetical protein
MNFGNAFEAATEGDGAQGAGTEGWGTVFDSVLYRVAVGFDGVGGQRVYARGREGDEEAEEAVGKTAVSSFLDSRWDSLGESQLRKWIRSHEDVGRRWYGDTVVGYYLT